MEVHSDTACVAVDAQVAHLEERIAAKDAALRSFKLALEAEEQLADEEGLPRGWMVSLAFKRERAHEMAAALSDGGEGKVREQAKWTIAILAYSIHPAHSGPPATCTAFLCVCARAALDALKGE